jgi:flagellar motor switch protein FliN
MSDLPPPYPGINSNQGPGYPNQAPGYPNQAPGYVPNQAPGYVPNQAPGYAPPGPGYPNQAPGYPNQVPGYAPPPAYPPTEQNGFQQQPYAGGASGSVYPNLPSQPFGFNAPSAPSKYSCFYETFPTKPG